MTRAETLTDFLDYVGHTGDVGSRNTAERILNRVLQTIASKRAWRVLLFPTAYEFQTVANTRGYALPAYFGRVSGIDGKIRNLTTGEQLYPRTREDIEAQNPAVGTTLETPGRPGAYYLAGTQPVEVQPASAGEALEVLSDNPADTAVRVEVAGIRPGGFWDRQQVTLTGATPVGIGNWTKVHEFAKGYPEGTTPTTELTSSEGEARLQTAVTGAVVFQRLQSWESSREVQVMNVFPVPDGIYTIAVPFIRRLMKTFKDADSIPADWGPAVFEEMHIEWQVNAGELSRQGAAQTARPALIDLVSLENAAAAQALRHRVPFG